MTEVADDVIQVGLAAWLRGDLVALEAILDPAVTLRAVQPGPGDCEDRDQLMRLLRQREAERDPEAPREVELTGLDDTTFVASGLGGDDGVATCIIGANQKVVAMQQFVTDTPDPDAEVAVAAIRSGDAEALRRVLAERPDLASARIPGFKGRTLLLITTDWPGHYPNVAGSIRALLAAGADVNQAGLGEHPETPLHWAASSDDVDAINALLDGGANINAPGAVIGDGTPLNDATAFGQWEAAKLLVERGAEVSAWDAAALGMTGRVKPLPTDAGVTELFWAACHGNQRETAEYLLDAGADINWVGYGDQTGLDEAEQSDANDLAEWLRSRGAVRASGEGPRPPTSTSSPAPPLHVQRTLHAADSAFIARSPNHLRRRLRQPRCRFARSAGGSASGTASRLVQACSSWFLTWSRIL